MKNKKVIIGILLITIIGAIGVSYAWLKTTLLGEKEYVIKAGALDLILDETSNGLIIDQAIPVSDEVGLQSSPATFQVINHSKSDVCYEIYLDDDTLSEEEIRVEDKYIKYSLDKESKKGTPKNLTEAGNNPSRLIDTHQVRAGKKVEYNLRLWFSTDIDGEYSNQIFKAKLRIEAIQCKMNVPTMKAYTTNETSDYHSEEYRTKVTSITTKNDINIPTDAIANWDVSQTEDGSVIAYALDDGAGGYTITIGGKDKLYANDDSSNLFYQFQALKSINLENLITTYVTNMNAMFQGCTNLTDLNLQGINTSNVENMSKMFYACSNLTNLDISSFNTSSVTNMSRMFYGCNSLTTLNLENFDTTNVTSMTNMFLNCINLISLNLSSFNTGNVEDMSCMFQACSKLENLNINHFDVQNVKNMASMFQECNALNSLNLQNWNAIKVENMSKMFYRCTNLSTLNMTGFTTQNILDMSRMFYGCSSLANLDLSNFDTARVTTMNKMFTSCVNLRQINIGSKWTTQNADIQDMMEGCNNVSWCDASGCHT